MPAHQTGSPMTYMLNGRQYIVVAVGGGGLPAETGGVPAAGSADDELALRTGPGSGIRDRGSDRIGDQEQV